MQRYINAIGLFIVCFVAGYSYLHYSTEPGQVNRDPAAIKGGFDFSHLSGTNLQEAVKQRLLSGIEVKKTSQGAGISLGHFLFLDEKGEKKLACHEFGKVTLSFVAEGVSVAGDRPTMELEGSCEFSSDLSRINSLVIPVAKILNEKPGDGEFQFNEGQPVIVRFANLPEDWPHTWLLRSVKLSNDKKGKAFIVETQDVSKYLGHPLVLTF